MFTPTPFFYVSLNKGAEFWLIGFRPGRTAEAYRTLGRWAADPRLDFDWGDAALMCLRLRELLKYSEDRPGHQNYHSADILAVVDLPGGTVAGAHDLGHTLKR